MNSHRQSWNAKKNTPWKTFTERLTQELSNEHINQSDPGDVTSIYTEKLQAPF